jgi:hypothetical protein
MLTAVLAFQHLAAIEFLTQELEEMQPGFRRNPGSHDQLDNISISSPQSEMNGFRTTCVDGSRPHSTAPRTPQSATSSLASQSLAERSRYSVDHAQAGGAPPLANVTTSQTYVFSAVDGTPMQPRTKKKMSTQERKDYKETRKRGACEKCRKTKAKVFNKFWGLVLCLFGTPLTNIVHPRYPIEHFIARKGRPPASHQKVRLVSLKAQLLTHSIEADLQVLMKTKLNLQNSSKLRKAQAFDKEAPKRLGAHDLWSCHSIPPTII